MMVIDQRVPENPKQEKIGGEDDCCTEQVFGGLDHNISPSLNCPLNLFTVFLPSSKAASLYVFECTLRLSSLRLAGMVHPLGW